MVGDLVCAFCMRMSIKATTIDWAVSCAMWVPGMLSLLATVEKTASVFSRHDAIKEVSPRLPVKTLTDGLEATSGICLMSFALERT